MEINKPQFVNSDIAGVTGLSLPTIQTWVNRGILIPTAGQNPGTGQRRLYSAVDACKLAILGELTGLGFPPGEAKKVAEWVGQRLNERGEEGATFMLWIQRKRIPYTVISAPPPPVTGEGPYSYTIVHGKLDLGFEEQTCIVLPVGMIVTMTLRALGMILGDGEILNECIVETADGKTHKVVMPPVYLEGTIEHGSGASDDEGQK